MNTTDEKISELHVIVDAVQLFEQEITHENQEEIINKYVELIDPNGKDSPFGSPNKNQETTIHEGSQMVWTIKTLNDDEDGVASFKAVLESMVQEIDSDKCSGFFKEGNPIYVNGKNQIVGNVVTDDTIKNDAEERYILRFHISKGDELKDSMTIDRKLLFKKKI